jgi:hypothetical protein
MVRFSYLEKGNISHEKRRRQTITILNLKKWAIQSLSQSSNLRAVLLLEKDRLTIEEFLAKQETWLKLARLEETSSRLGGSSFG